MLDVRPCGEAAVFVTAVDEAFEECWGRVHALARRLHELTGAGIRSAIATYDTVLVEYDPIRLDPEQVEFLIRLSDEMEIAADGVRTWTVPVLYGGDFGPDLVAVADLLEVAPDQAAAVHEDNVVAMRCFAAGAAAMLDGPGYSSAIPRLESPRTRVMAGQIAVAGEQSIMFASPVPSGWRIIGRTPVSLLGQGESGIVPYAPGDRFRFRAISDAAWGDYGGMGLSDVQ